MDLKTKEPETKEPKKFLFVSYESLSGDLAWAIKNEGHEVKQFLENKDDTDVYNGILDKVDDWKKYIDWADVIIFDNTGFGKDADELRAKGKLVVGGSVYTDRLEEDRGFGQNEMKAAGFSVVPHWDFNDFDSAIDFIKKNPDQYVFKPSGNMPSSLKGILFLSQEDDSKDLIQLLEQNKKTWAQKMIGFQLQKMVVGVEVAIGTHFNGKDFIYPISVNFEHKKFCTGNIGPLVGDTGALNFWSQSNELFKSTLLKMKDKLAASGYVGYIDINCIVNAKGIYPLEFTSRWGYPTISVHMEGVTSGWGDFLYHLAKHETPEFKTKKGFQIGVCIVISPYPFRDQEEADIYRDLSILFKKPNLDGFHLGDLKKINGSFAVAGTAGYIGVITGAGTTVEDARKQAYLRISNIILQNMYYRTDIGSRWMTSDSDKLLTWGYLNT